jgi:hypothetical protein
MVPRLIAARRSSRSSTRKSPTGVALQIRGAGTGDEALPTLASESDRRLLRRRERRAPGRSVPEIPMVPVGISPFVEHIPLLRIDEPLRQRFADDPARRQIRAGSIFSVRCDHDVPGAAKLAFPSPPTPAPSTLSPAAPRAWCSTRRCSPPVLAY